MINRRKSLTIILSALVCIAVFAAAFGITYAILKNRQEALNSFTVGETRTQVVEEFELPEEQTPGKPFTKEPKVENTGNLACFVRVRADFSDSNIGKDCTFVGLNTTDWVYNASDGYYYYTKLLQPGKLTESLFTGVLIKTGANTQDFNIIVYSESIQHDDHTGGCTATEYTSAWAAWS